MNPSFLGADSWLSLVENEGEYKFTMVSLSKNVK